MNRARVLGSSWAWAAFWFKESKSDGLSMGTPCTPHAVAKPTNNSIAKINADPQAPMPAKRKV
jgi:hypothetical protein